MANMGNVMGIIFANMHDNAIHDLTKSRTMGSVPFGGRYRLIDFPLSNMVNSGMSEVGVITKSNYQSLLDHLGSGREWDLSRKTGGLHLLPPFGHVGSGIYRGRLEALKNVIGFIEHSNADHVIMCDSDVITNMDFRPIVNAHKKSNADITVVYASGHFTADQTANKTIINVNEDNRVIDVLTKPKMAGELSASLNIFVIGRKFLIDLAAEAASRSLYSFEVDVLQHRTKELEIIGYEYKGDYEQIDSVAAYYKANMKLLEQPLRRSLFNSESPIYTKIRDEAPAKHGIDAICKNSIVADGCIIEGEVENSILFRGVHIGKGAKVKDSIIMQGTHIGKKCEVRYTITDKEVEIADYRVLTGSQSYPIFIEKRAQV